MTKLKLTKKKKEEHAHDLLHEGLYNATTNAILNLDAAHVCYVSLYYVVGLIFDASPNKEEALEMIDDVVKDVLKEAEKEKANGSK
mgnify:CR=1 FL=1